MRFSDFILSEMPITNFQLVGQWDNTKRKYGYGKSDAGILTNQKAVDKIHKAWSNSKQNYSIYFVKSPQAYKHSEVGEVTSEWIKANIGIDIPADPRSITVVFTNNIGDQKVPMTAWIMAHRFGHVVNRVALFQQYFVKEMLYDLKQILQSVYGVQGNDGLQYGMVMRNKDNPYLALVNALGTMRSVRTNNLRNFDEFYFEVLAQYLTTGKITFNKLPPRLTLSTRYAWGNPTSKSMAAQDAPDAYDDHIEGLAEKYEANLDTILGGLVGKIFLM